MVRSCDSLLIRNVQILSFSLLLFLEVSTTFARICISGIRPISFCFVLNPSMVLPHFPTEVTSFQDQARGNRLQQQAHQAGREDHHPGDHLSAARPQDPWGDIHVGDNNLVRTSNPNSVVNISLIV